VLWR